MHLTNRVNICIIYSRMSSLYFKRFNRYSFNKYCSLHIYYKNDVRRSSDVYKYMFFHITVVSKGKILYSKWFFRYIYGVKTISGILFDLILYCNEKWGIVVFEVNCNRGKVYDIYYDARIKRFSFYNFQIFDYSGLNYLKIIRCFKRFGGKFRCYLRSKLKLIPICSVDK